MVPIVIGGLAAWGIDRYRPPVLWSVQWLRAPAGDDATDSRNRLNEIKDEMLYIQAGAGIVADSVPSLEWAETMNKARAVFKAVSMACSGLDGESIQF